MMVSTQSNLKTTIDSSDDTLLSFLKERGYNTQLKQGLQITPATQGSGKTDISINHDQIISQ
jgi:hypothetical protein